MNKENIFIIIPVYNDFEPLDKLIVSLHQNNYSNIIIIDDGSGSEPRPTSNNAGYYYLRHQTNLGQGAALQTGFTYAKQMHAEAVVTFDADGQHDVNDIAILLVTLQRNEADMVMGSRFLSNGNPWMPISKIVVLKLARIVNFLFSGLLLSDAHNGLRALNKNALEKVVLAENRMAHASELLFEAKRHKLRIKEVPVQIHYTKYALKKGQSPWDALKILFDLVLHKLFK